MKDSLFNLFFLLHIPKLVISSFLETKQTLVVRKSNLHHIKFK